MNNDSSSKSAHPGDHDTRRPAPSRPASSTPNVMGDLLAKSKVANATPCPNCKTYLRNGDVVCTHCGYNSATGKATATRVVEIKKKESGRKAWPFSRN
ncbi:MAG: zinc ribbon domain-containing protein [Phycisphaerales bacterium JB041]